MKSLTMLLFVAMIPIAVPLLLVVIASPVWMPFAGIALAENIGFGDIGKLIGMLAGSCLGWVINLSPFIFFGDKPCNSPQR